MNLTRFEACATGDMGRQLLPDDFAIGQAIGFTSSPTLLVNNKQRATGADPRTIQQAICLADPQLRGYSAQLSGPPPRPQGQGGGGCGGG
jgi:hypothetical protein